MPTIISNITQKVTPEQHLVRDVSSILSALEPDIYPLDTLTRRMKKGNRATQVKIEWAKITNLPRTDTIKTASLAGSSGGYVDIDVNNLAMWRVDDLIITVDNLTNPVLWVSNIVAGKLRVYALGIRSSGNSGLGTVPALAVNTKLGWIGNAKQEGFNASTPKSLMPDYDYNFCELSDTVISSSKTRRATENYTEHDWIREQKEQLKEFRLSFEYKKWFGKRSETVDPTTGELRWTMGGVTNYISKAYSYNYNATTPITEAKLIDWLVAVFGGNNGSTTRFLFADTYLTGELLKVPLNNLRSRELVQVLGVKVEKLEFNFGEVYLKHTRAFNELGKNHYGVILDLEQVALRELRPLERIPLEFEKQGTDKIAQQYIEQSSLEVRLPDAHAIIYGTSS